MTHAGYVRRVCLSLAAVSMLAAAATQAVQAAPSKAAVRGGSATAYDGNYSVEVITDQGTCERVYRWSIAVSNGRIASTGDVVVQASGEINRRGIVSVAFRRGDQVAHAAGRMSGRMGSGTWSAPAMQCGGRWRAERRG